MIEDTYMRHEDVIQEYEAGLEEMERQRRFQQGRLLNGAVMSRDPNRMNLQTWLKQTSDPLPDVLQVWANNLIKRGVYYHG